VWYAFWNGTKLLAEGAQTYSYTLTIPAPTVITVAVRDARGVTVKQDIALSYTAPVTPPVVTPPVNQPPSLDVGVTPVNKRTNRYTIKSSDSDGKIERVQVYLNGFLIAQSRPRTQSFTGYLTLPTGNYVLKVVVQDSSGAKTEKSVSGK
jgi:hypothetical protein